MLRLIIWLLLNFFNCLFFAPVACSISTSSGSRRRRWERGCHFHLPLSFPSRHFLSYNKFVVDEAVWSQLCCFCFTLRFNYSKASFYKCLLLLLNKKKERWHRLVVVGESFKVLQTNPARNKTIDSHFLSNQHAVHSLGLSVFCSNFFQRLFQRAQWRNTIGGFKIKDLVVP